MKKIDIFTRAMAAESFRFPQWLRSAFGIVEEDRGKAMADPIAYRVIRTSTTCFVVDPQNKNELVIIDDAAPGEPIFKQHEVVTLTKEMGIPGITQDTATTYGRWLLNQCCLFYPFGSIFPYQNKKFFASDVEDMVKPIFTDDPENPEDRKPGRVYVSDYLKFGQAKLYLEEFMYLFTPAGSDKTMTCSDELPKLKRELFAKNKDRLGDPAVLAAIGNELEAADRDWLKGDVAMDSLLAKKDFAVVRKKLFGFQGGEAGFSDGTEMVAIENSLDEGWDISKFAAMNDVSRVGSYNRGFQTAMGGADYKDILRATSNLRITKDDCGTKLGMPIRITESERNKYIGLYRITETGKELITADNVAQLIDKPVVIRGPNFCSLTFTDFCATCCGTRLSVNKDGLSAATSDITQVFMGLFMQSMHGKALAVTDYDFNTEMF